MIPGIIQVMQNLGIILKNNLKKPSWIFDPKLLIAMKRFYLESKYFETVSHLICILNNLL